MYVSAADIQGQQFVLQTVFSRGNTSSFFSTNPQAQPAPTRLPEPLLSILTSTIPERTSQIFQELFRGTIYIQGLAPNTHKTYQSSHSHCVSFYQHHNLSLLPATELTLLLFMASLAKEVVSYTTINFTYLLLGACI